MAQKLEKLLLAAGLQAPESHVTDAGFELWKVRTITPFGATDHWVVHLQSDIRWTTAKSVRQAIRESNVASCHAVIERSSRLLSDRKRIVREFGVAEVMTRKEILGRALKSTIESALSNIAEADVGPFVEPSIANELGETQEGAVGFLLRWLSGDESTASQIGVVAADGGTGKTTIARQLYRQIARNRQVDQVPLLIESDHWKLLAENHELDLWDIWQRSLSAAHLNIALKNVFQTCIEEGIILPIFDGFDELCSRRTKQFRPEETLGELRKFVGEGEGRLLLTTRRGYWDSLEVDQKSTCSVFSLLPFNRFMRDKFFEKRFPRNFDARDRAKRLAARLEADLYEDVVNTYPPAPVRPTSIPAVLELIASSAESSLKSVSAEDGEANQRPSSEPRKKLALESVLELLCDREKLRHDLSASTAEQLQVFCELALEFEGEFRAEDIQLCSEIVRPGDAELGRRLVQAPHSFVVASGATGQYRFRFEFLHDFLRAQGIWYRWDSLAAPSAKSQIVRILSEESDGDAPLFDYLGRFFALGEDDAVPRLQRGVSQLQSRLKEVSSAVWHLVQKTVGGTNALTKEERTDALLRVLGNGTSRAFVGLHLEGRLSGFSFVSVVFVECVFSNVIFIGCEFSHLTRFVGCEFVEEFRVESCSGWARVTLERSGPLSDQARETFTGAPNSARSLITVEAIQRLFRLALQRFFRAGAFHSIDVANRNAGLLGQSALKEDVWDALTKEELVGHHAISGRGPKSGIAVPVSNQHEVRAYLDNQIVGTRLARAIDRVRSRWCDERVSVVPRGNEPSA